MPKDTTLTSPPSDKFYLEKCRIVRILAATKRLNSTAKHLCEVLLREYANRTEFETSGKMIVFPYTDTPTTKEPRSADYPPLTFATGLTVDQLHYAFAKLEALSILKSMRRGRHGRSTMRAFNLKAIADLAVELSRDTGRTVEESTLRTVEESTDSTVESSTDIECKNPLNNLLDLKPDNQSDQRAPEAQEGGESMAKEGKANSSREVPRQKSSDRPRRTKLKVTVAENDPGLATYRQHLPELPFFISENINYLKVTASQFAKLREKQYSDKVIFQAADHFTDKAIKRKKRGGSRLPLPHIDSLAKHCADIVRQRAEWKAADERQAAEEAEHAARERILAVKGAEFAEVMLPAVEEFRAMYSKPFDREEERMGLKDDFRSLCRDEHLNPDEVLAASRTYVQNREPHSRPNIDAVLRVVRSMRKLVV